MSMPRRPLIYVGDYDVRFSDLDPYGHMNAKHYLDIVTTTRLQFSERTLGVKIEKLAEQGIGFFLFACTQKFRRPIMGLCTVRASSFVEQAKGASVVVSYSITSLDQGTTYSDGTLEFAIMDLQNQKPMIAPPWVLDLFFES